MMKLFLDNGANPDGENSSDLTPLMLALELHHINLAVILLSQYNANPNKSNSNLSPLHIASKNGFIDIVKILLDKGIH